MPANPAYLMALPTKNDPMLSYLTTAFQDHVRIRERFGYQVDDRMWAFFQELGVIDADGRPTEHFGQPSWVYLQYRRRQRDARPDAEILAEARRAIARVRERGVDLAEGHGEQLWDLEPELDRRIRHLYDDSKKCIWAELPDAFAAALPGAVTVRTLSSDRTDYILHPPTGERLDASGNAAIAELRDRRARTLGRADRDLRRPQRARVDRRRASRALPRSAAPEPRRRRLRARARADRGDRRPRARRLSHRRDPLRRARDDAAARPAIVHLIGERPGSGHHAYSVYITAAPVSVWAEPAAPTTTSRGWCRGSPTRRSSRSARRRRR